jgi:hypothetical protein
MFNVSGVLAACQQGDRNIANTANIRRLLEVLPNDWRVETTLVLIFPLS